MGVRTDRLNPNETNLRRGGMSGYLLPFEIISIHLVVVLVGAAYLARARRRVVRRLPAAQGEGEAGPAEFHIARP